MYLKKLLIPFVTKNLMVETNDVLCLNCLEKIYPYLDDYVFDNQTHETIVINKNENLLYDILWRVSQEYSKWAFQNISENNLIFVLYEIISEFIEEKLLSENTLVFHGGVVEHNKKALCFIAKSQTGKSTLTYHLSINNKFNYFSDDHIIVEKTTNNVYPVLIPLKMRSMHFFNNDKNNDVIVEGSSITRSEYLYLVKPNIKYIGSIQSVPIHSFIILERGEFVPSIKKLNYANSYKGLVQNAKFSDKNSIYNINKKTFDIIKSTPVYLLKYCTLEDASKIIIDIINLEEK